MDRNSYQHNSYRHGERSPLQNRVDWCSQKKIVTVQRQLVNIQSGQTLQQTDVVHALDACLYYLLSNPKAPCPLIDPGVNSARELSQWFAQIAAIKKAHNGQGGAVKEKT